LLLTRYALERLLYGLSTTKYRERFVLKGAMLMTTWFDTKFRPDVDFLGFGDPNPDKVVAIFRQISPSPRTTVCSSTATRSKSSATAKNCACPS
jgi:hypothetical protein